jgi:hypothetical protein
LAILNHAIVFENYGVVDAFNIKPAIDLTLHVMQRFIVAAPLKAIWIPNGIYDLCP